MKKLLIPLALLLPAASLNAAISYNVGDTYTQDFNGLASTGTTNTWANDTTVQGWYWWSNSTNTPGNYTATSTTGPVQNTILSLGKATGDSNTGTVGDRALGGQGTNTSSTITYGMQILNTTGMTLNNFSLTYKGEQWRTISNEGADKLVLEYAVFAMSDPAVIQLATTSTSGWTAISALQFNAPTQIPSTTSSKGLDGNVNSATLSGGNATALNWTAGSELWIRWRDNNPAQSAMGVDDIIFSAAVPEPSALLLGALGPLLLLRRKR